MYIDQDFFFGARPFLQLFLDSAKGSSINHVTRGGDGSISFLKNRKNDSKSYLKRVLNGSGGVFHHS